MNLSFVIYAFYGLLICSLVGTLTEIEWISYVGLFFFVVVLIGMIIHWTTEIYESIRLFRDKRNNDKTVP